MIEVNCYNCGSGDRKSYAIENGFNLVKCCSCGLLYMTPRPEDEAISEACKHGMHRGERTLQSMPRFDKGTVRKHMRVLRDIYADELQGCRRNWLDVGCGWGELLLALSRVSKGMVCARGIDPSLKKQKYAKTIGVDISYFDLRDHRERYDVISMLNVFSHLPNPVQFIETLTRCLKPGGELLLQTGDTAGLPAEKHYRPFCLPEHMCFASEEIIVDILQKCDLQIVRIVKYSPFPLTWRIERVAKEFLKLFIPGKQSQLWSLAGQHKLSGKFRTDMYVRARLSTDCTP